MIFKEIKVGLSWHIFILSLIRKSASISVVFISVMLTSCTKNSDDFGPQTDDNETPIAGSQRVVVLNEGNFMFGNGSVSVIDNSIEQVSNEAFKQANGYPLGDVPQSLMVHDSLGYIIVNNSGKIEVVDWADFKSVKTIKINYFHKIHIREIMTSIIGDFG